MRPQDQQDHDAPSRVICLSGRSFWPAGCCINACTSLYTNRKTLMARRRADVWDDFFEALRWLFTVVHPAWSILVAAVFFFFPVIWFQHSIKIPEAQMLGYMWGRFHPSSASLPGLPGGATGSRGWYSFSNIWTSTGSTSSVGRTSSDRWARSIGSAAIRWMNSAGVEQTAALTSGSGATAQPPSSSARGGRPTR